MSSHQLDPGRLVQGEVKTAHEGQVQMAGGIVELTSKETVPLLENRVSLMMMSL